MLCSTMLLFATASPAKADDLECVSTTFRMLSPSDKVCVSQFDDPKVPGVTCYISQARKGGWGQPLGLNEDPSNFSVTCRQMGRIEVDLATLPESEEAFSEKTSIFFKKTRIYRISRPDAEYAGLSRNQCQADRRLAGQFGQRRADHAVAEVTRGGYSAASATVSMPARYFSASSAAMQPRPAAVTA
jgi:CreA protein